MGRIGPAAKKIRESRGDFRPGKSRPGQDQDWRMAMEHEEMARGIDDLAQAFEIHPQKGVLVLDREEAARRR